MRAVTEGKASSGEETSPSGVSFSGNVRKNDGNIEISISPDCMSATAVLYPPIGDGAPLSPNYAAELLARMGIVHGVFWDDLTERILDANIERHIIRDVVVARGTAPVSEHPEHIVVEDRFKPGFRPIDQNEPSVDWKTISPYVIVKKGEPIGTIIERQDGVPGTDILDRSLPYGKDQFQAWSLGKNVERQDNEIVATTEGRVNLDGAKISIDEILLIKSDVDYRIGHIMFPGDVIIEGGVGAGFKIYAGGSISIKKTMDAFDVSAKKDLICTQGIIGKEQAFVRVGGNLKAKFVENAKVAIRGDAEIAGSLVGTKLYTLGKLSMGDKGRIVGGEIFATHGVICGWIGGSTRPLTLINVGMDFTMQQKLDQANNALRELSTKLARLESMLKTRAEDGIKRLRDEVLGKVQAMAANIADLSQRVDIDEQAVVEVRNTVYPGTTIAICHIKINVEEPIKKAKFKLDTTANRIVIEH
ncbi:MAG: hypothetical protein A3J97_01895 [Spirochaetes bacterium RIFOXYC1_FULL_54_7]|nr:MAG: hypothetical protein A3J97_01895 [Spirochaetes bacterium RIFOXYC1_FULL_54_7]